MRPELVMRNRIPLCSDCYTGWVRQSSVHWCNQVKQAANRCATVGTARCGPSIAREYRLLTQVVQRRNWVPLVCLPLPLPLPCRLRKNIMPACAEFLSSHLDPQHGLDRLAYLVHSYSPMLSNLHSQASRVYRIASSNSHCLTLRWDASAGMASRIASSACCACASF